MPCGIHVHHGRRRSNRHRNAGTQAQTVTVTGVTDDDISHNVVIFTHEVTSGTYAAASRYRHGHGHGQRRCLSLMLGNVVPG